MNNSLRLIVICAGLLGCTGVALGAFGAHALKGILAGRGSTATWQTAVSYHLLHAVALLALAGMAGHWPQARWIGLCWTVGVIGFSGSLYWLALGGPRLLGPITPLGGLALIIGWGLVAWNAWTMPKA